VSVVPLEQMEDDVDAAEIKQMEESLNKRWKKGATYKKANTLGEDDLDVWDVSHLEHVEKDDDPYDEASAGCTAVTCLLRNKRLYVANAGDSRCVICRGGTAVALSEDHKPELDRERERIYAGNGYIENGRVNGNLNLSR